MARRLKRSMRHARARLQNRAGAAAQALQTRRIPTLKRSPLRRSLMSKFIITFLTVYGAMHVLVYHRIRVLLPDRWFVQGLAVVFLIVMATAPISTRLLERNGYELPARWMGHAGFYWMGFVFLAFTIVLLMGAYDAFSWGVNGLTHLGLPYLTGRLPALLMVLLVSALCVHGFFEARHIRVERVQIETSKLPQGVNKIKIAQISDVHLGLIVRDDRLRIILDRVHSEAPDILVSTGDLVDGMIDHLPELSTAFERIQPPYGKYAVTGNHEVYAGLDRSEDFIRKSGFTLLRGEAKTINPLINIVGVDDPAVRRSNPAQSSTTAQEVCLLSSVQNNLFTLLLRHRPEVPEETLGLFDLQLSGHTHRGQIFPFNFVVATQYPLLNGYYELAKNSKLYTSRGSGTWGPPIRVGAPPEVTIIELVRKAVSR
jgi:uncharacterized protein